MERALELAVVALALLFHAAFFAWFPPLRSPNELTRVYLASALVEDGTVRIDRQLKHHGKIFDVSVRVADGERHYYSDKAPGVALLTVPVLALYEAIAGVPSLNAKLRLTRLWVSTLPTVLLLVLLLARLRELLHTPRLPVLLVLAYALGSVATPYAGLAYGHQLTAVLLFALFAAILRTSPQAPAWRSAVVGAGAALAVMVEYPSVLLLAPFALFFLQRVRLRPHALIAAALGALPLIALLLGYHQLAFGSPFKTGYSFIASSFKEVHAQGLLGVAWPRAEHAYLSFLSPAKGLFFFARRRERRTPRGPRRRAALAALRARRARPLRPIRVGADLSARRLDRVAAPSRARGALHAAADRPADRPARGARLVGTAPALRSGASWPRPAGRARAACAVQLRDLRAGLAALAGAPAESLLAARLAAVS
jgi:hypothetical protein